MTERAADVVLLGAARTPFGRFGGGLRDLSVPELASVATTAALSRAGVAPEDVEEMALGVNLPGSDRSVARQAALRTGIPEDRSSYTVDRACCSSLTALSMVARAVRAREAEVVVAGGAENLSKVPYFLEDLRWGRGLGTVTMTDQLVISCPHTNVPRAVQASEEAATYGVTRLEQDEWALRSQQRFASADEAGLLDVERVPVALEGGGTFERDESGRPDTTMEKLARLKPIYGSESVTAGNAPGLSTGASSLVLASGDAARRRDVEPLASIVATAMASGHPAGIASIPAVAAARVLARAGIGLDDVALIEINEAFAAVPLVATLVMAEGDVKAAERLRERVNVNGGAIAVGHPTGASGARLVMTLAHALTRRGGGYGLVTICGGIGEAEAVVIKVG